MYGWKQDVRAVIREGAQVHVALVNPVEGDERTVAGRLWFRSRTGITIARDERRMEIPWYNICCITEA